MTIFFSRILIGDLIAFSYHVFLGFSGLWKFLMFLLFWWLWHFWGALIRHFVNVCPLGYPDIFLKSRLWLWALGILIPQRLSVIFSIISWPRQMHNLEVINSKKQKIKMFTEVLFIKQQMETYPNSQR